MVIATLLFLAGFALGWRYNALAVVMSTPVIFFCSTLMFSVFLGFGLVQLVVVFAYLIAHQSGYLTGVYFSYSGVAQVRAEPSTAPVLPSGVPPHRGVDLGNGIGAFAAPSTEPDKT
jgi:hypothetical protein